MKLLKAADACFRANRGYIINHINKACEHGEFCVNIVAEKISEELLEELDEAGYSVEYDKEDGSYTICWFNKWPEEEIR